MLALLLASIGIYGTLSYIVRARAREIRFRLALGASPGDILSRTLGCGLAPPLAGGIMGLVVAVGIARAFRAVFFEIVPVDPQSIAVGGALPFIAAIIAALGPAPSSRARRSVSSLAFGVKHWNAGRQRP